MKNILSYRQKVVSLQPLRQQKEKQIKGWFQSETATPQRVN
jgi:hypothetical protein